MTKVIHVHLLHERKNYYFGSVSAVFKRLSADQVGCSEDYLRKMLREDGNHHLTQEALIIRSHLIRASETDG
ncbi:MAG: hypothetical protein IJ190_00975 [Prevotella sp.]|nr:hypothetical protein [Prevotella sp.]